jgi:hypothetical protein
MPDIQATVYRAVTYYGRWHYNNLHGEWYIGIDQNIKVTHKGPFLGEAVIQEIQSKIRSLMDTHGSNMDRLVNARIDSLHENEFLEKGGKVTQIPKRKPSAEKEKPPANTKQALQTVLGNLSKEEKEALKKRLGL